MSKHWADRFENWRAREDSLWLHWDIKWL